MNAAVLIATREIRDRSRLFIIAAAMAVVPFVAVFAVRENRPLAIAMVAAVLAVAYSCSLAIALGVSTIGRELTEKRLSFLFTRPVSAASIWFGKVAASLLTIFGVLVIIVLPTFLFAHGGWSDMWTAGGDAILFASLIASTVLFFFGHTASTMLRSRSALVGLDFAMLAVMVVAIFALVRPIVIGGGHELTEALLAIVGGVMVLVLAVAPVWQLAKGRVDARQNHKALSVFLWTAMAVVLILTAAYALWVISPPLASIDQRFVIDQTPSGKWAYVSGMTPGRGSYLASYLVDTTTGDRERIAVSPWGRVHFAGDGNSIIWFEDDDLLPRGRSFRLHTRRLEPNAKPVATQLVMPMPSDAQISDDGARLATVRGDRTEVYDIASGKLLGAARGIIGNNVSAMIFAGPDVVRLFEDNATGGMRVRELDLVRRKLTTTVERPSDLRGYRGTVFSGDGSRIFLRRQGEIVDAHTGATVAKIPVAADGTLFTTMLRDGSVVMTRDSKLYHFDRTGKLVAEVAIPVRRAGVVGQLGASKVLLAVTGTDPSRWRILIVDLVGRKLERSVDGVLGPVPTWWSSVIREFPEDATFVSLSSARELVLWNARTGVKRPFPM
jgi:hypothetical protein